MHVLFEEDGDFKVAAILADHETSLQVETSSGKRGKIKPACVLLRFVSPSPHQVLDEAKALAKTIDISFLWEVTGDGEFAFHDLARDYFGQNPKTQETVSILLALHAAPVYFHRKGKGRFRKASADILQAALASLEKKRQQALAVETWAAELTAGRLPPELLPYAESLLDKPDRNKPEIKAFEIASSQSGLSVSELLLKVGALKSPYELHMRRFLREQFPKGVNFPAGIDIPPVSDDLPRAGVCAFSIDDAQTTEVDDALSVTPLPGMGWKIGIHIAAPGLAVTKGSPLDGIARARLSTVYIPGSKITMLPDAVIRAYTLEGGRECPALSLYLTVDEAFNILDIASAIEYVQIAANLRHHDIEPWFNAHTVQGLLPDHPFKDELYLLWRFAMACLERRGKPSASLGMYDYNFSIEGNLADPEQCRVKIKPRERGSPLDTLVAELMIIANTAWSALLSEHCIACMYRTQTGGKTRMSTVPHPHEGLGVPQYAWMTSPLRRYADLVNQWQLIAHLSGKPPPFAARSAEMFAAIRDFEYTYTAYAQFQRNMERYWCLRWLAQENCRPLAAKVRRDDLVQFEGLPFITRLPGASGLAPGQRVLLGIDRLDFLNLEAVCHVLEKLPDAAPGLENEPELEEMGDFEPVTPKTPALEQLKA